MPSTSIGGVAATSFEMISAPQHSNPGLTWPICAWPGVGEASTTKNKGPILRSDLGIWGSSSRGHWPANWPGNLSRARLAVQERLSLLGDHRRGSLRRPRVQLRLAPSEVLGSASIAGDFSNGHGFTAPCTGS